MARILVGMSGGVDSSVSAALLAAQGEEPVGVWMRLNEPSEVYCDYERSCCTMDAAEDARRVAGQIGIPFYILNLEREFLTAVIDPFLAGYRAGRTPNPCIACNQVIKFEVLLAQARALYGCEAVATGHYARITQSPDGRYQLRRGRDGNKDQSYFLYSLTQAQLPYVRFPLGELTKPQVRELARDFGLVTAEKSESQEICFVPGGDYRAVLAQLTDWQPTEGALLDYDGRQVGTHQGTANFTIGQRKGLGVALGEPRFVWQLEPASNVVRLGRRADLDATSFMIDQLILSTDVPGENYRPLSFEATVQIRYRATPVAARITAQGEDRWSVETASAVWAPTPGQAAVFYQDDLVLGGGLIL
jgi:tRNA-specific 2-thiouridylase